MVKNSEFNVMRAHPEERVSHRREIATHLRGCAIPDDELLSNVGLYMNRPQMSRLLFMHEMYVQASSVLGIAVEFGCRWGVNLSILINLRTVLEPQNLTRKVVGFDTWEGFPSVHERDGNAEFIEEGAYGVVPGYKSDLEKILCYHESESPYNDRQRFELVQGDVCRTLPEYLDAHPETVIAFAYFDMDLYEPTKEALKLIRPYLTKGSVIGFDEPNHPDFPGETIALREAWGLDRYRLVKSPHYSLGAYAVID